MQNFSFAKMYLKISSVKWRPFCPGGDELKIGHQHSNRSFGRLGDMPHYRTRMGSRKGPGTSRYRLNSASPGQNGHHFADDIFKCIFMNGKCCILIRISLKIVHRGPIDNNSALVQIMAWRRTGDKLLSEPMLTQFIDAYMRHLEEMS